MKLSEIAREVIGLADAIRHYWDKELPKRHPDYPIVHPGEESGPPPPEEKKLQDLLASLPEDAIYQLLLLTYLGRGDFSSRDLAAQFESLKRAFGKPEWAVSQMLEKPPLADYLSEGLEELKKQNVDVDKMLPRPARSRK